MDQIDLVLIMSVEPGFGGQKFMPEVLDKVKKIKEIVTEKKLNMDIEIDGGINFKNSKLVKDAGANVLVSGSTIFNENNGDLKKKYRVTSFKLRNVRSKRSLYLSFITQENNC